MGLYGNRIDLIHFLTDANDDFEIIDEMLDLVILTFNYSTIKVMNSECEDFIKFENENNVS